MVASVLGTRISNLESTAQGLGYDISTKFKADGSVVVVLERGGLVRNQRVFEGMHKVPSRGYNLSDSQIYEKALENAVKKMQAYEDRLK